MTKLFLSLDDAVLVATRNFDIDPQLARQEFEQKCYISDNQYAIGYHNGINDVIKAIKDKAESENSAKIDCSKTKCENCTNHNYCDYEINNRQESGGIEK